MYGSLQSWKQTFVLDRYGNRTFDTSDSNTTTLPSGFNGDIYNPTIDTSNNRYSSGQGYSYDAAGNVTANAAGQSFTYDAEDHQTEVRSTSTSALVATYQYDGSGRRVKKIVGSEETTFIYDAMGKSVAEYTLNSTTTPDIKTRYTTEDQLGSPRVITDGIGQVQERHEYMPYGEEAGSALSGVRTSAQRYAGASELRQRYTGHDRDDESGLDYANARYYSSAHGRFTSVDPLTASATIKDPQTFNRYSYGLNSPYEFTDPLGLSSEPGGGMEEDIREFDRLLRSHRRWGRGTDPADSSWRTPDDGDRGGSESEDTGDLGGGDGPPPQSTSEYQMLDCGDRECSTSMVGIVEFAVGALQRQHYVGTNPSDVSSEWTIEATMRILVPTSHGVRAGYQYTIKYDGENESAILDVDCSGIVPIIVPVDADNTKDGNPIADGEKDPPVGSRIAVLSDGKIKSKGGTITIYDGGKPLYKISFTAGATYTGDYETPGSKFQYETTYIHRVQAYF